MHKSISRARLSLGRFSKDQDGVTAIEYALIAALIAVVIIGGLTLIGTNLDTLFRDIAGRL